MKAAPPISRSNAAGNVAITQEGQRPELSAIAGRVRGRFLLEPLNQRAERRPLEVVLSHAFQIRRTGKHRL